MCRYRKGCVGRLERMDPSLTVASIMLNPELDVIQLSDSDTSSATLATSNNMIGGNTDVLASAGTRQSVGSEGTANLSYNVNPVYAKQLFMLYPAKGSQPAGSLPLSDYVWFSSYA